MESIERQKFKKLFHAPIGKFRLIAISDSDVFSEEEPEIRDFRSLKKAKDAANRRAKAGKIAEVYDSKGEFVYQGRFPHS